MRIALDFDGTYSRDPDFWDGVVALAKKKGHKVIGVTMRYADEPINNDPAFVRYLNVVDRVIFTGRLAKAEYLKSYDIAVDVWIDDMPYFLYANG